MNNWHPDAIRAQHDDAGPFTVGQPKLVWHTVEGYGLPNYAGTAPHFTLSIKTGKLWQHMPINLAAKALMHPAGTVETNHAHAIQVELTDAFAKDSQDWTPVAYARIASLARWIEKNAGVARQCNVKFGPHEHLPARLAPRTWLRYAGHCGHQHVPNNEHWDPGAFRIELVLGGGADIKRKRARWANHLARLRVEAKRYGWTRPRRIIGRRLKYLLTGVKG